MAGASDEVLASAAGAPPVRLQPPGDVEQGSREQDGPVVPPPVPVPVAVPDWDGATMEEGVAPRPSSPSGGSQKYLVGVEGSLASGKSEE